MKRIRKAVFPVAGLGTRFLPVTKASPKEMLPIVDKPLIQYAVEEAMAAGITELVFITGRNKRAIEDHFDKAYELENELKGRGKKKMLDLLDGIIPAGVTCIYIRQIEALGLGHAVLCARPVINNEPFAVILADDLIRAETPVMAQMSALHDYHRCSIVGVQQIAPEDAPHYGVVKAGRGSEDGLHKMTGIVEKPAPEEAPSPLGVVGRYILTPRIFSILADTARGTGGEIQLTDGIARLIREEQVLAYEFEGRRYDCGGKFGYVQATLEYGLDHPEIGTQLRAYLKGRSG